MASTSQDVAEQDGLLGEPVQKVQRGTKVDAA